MLLAVILNNLSSRIGLITENTSAASMGKLVKNFLTKAVRIGRKGLF
jgi:hypothetical protein